MPRSGSFRLIFGLMLAVGCGPVISTGLQQEAGPRVSFAELSARPDKYKGRLDDPGRRGHERAALGAGQFLAVDQRQLDDRSTRSAPPPGAPFWWRATSG